MIARIKSALSSPRLAWWLLVVLLACLLISFLIPQRPIVGEAIYAEWKADVGFPAVFAESLGLASIFTSWPFLIAMLLLFLNLSFCTAKRFSARRRRQVRVTNPPENAAEFKLKADASPEGVRSLVGPFWALHQPSDDQYVWERGVWGWRGSILMHFGLLALVIAGVVSGLTRFSGELVLAEGQTVLDAPEAYSVVSQTPRFGAGFTGAPLSLQRLDVTYEGSTIVDVTVLMSDGPQGATRAVRVNEPFRTGGKAYLVSNSGHAVALRVSDDQELLLDAVVNLGGVTPQGNSDSIAVRDGLEVTMTVLPDGEAPKAAKVKQRLLLVDPVVEVQVSGSTVPVRLRPGEAARIGSVTVSIEDVLYWTEFLVRSDRGLPLAYVGFAMVLLGTAIRWLDPDVRVVLALSADRSEARVWHRARFAEAVGVRASDKLTSELRDNGGQRGVD